jgi:beta-galactosidase
LVLSAKDVVASQLSGRNAILLGTAWYPEQWDESRWEIDLSLMEEAHIGFVRVGEFAWSRMEPAEGRFEFEWLDRAIRAAARHHIAVVLGTPTAAPPAWLTKKYPDVLRVGLDGRRAKHGTREQASATSIRYRAFSRQIAEKMAVHFGHNSDVVGWQIDNEVGSVPMSTDAHTLQLFHQWLKRKFGTLASLNKSWTTSYWSQTYDDWSEIPIPDAGHNPGLILEWKHFITDMWADYQKNEIDAIRRYADPNQFITTNLQGFFNGLDQYIMSRPLTFDSWDDYVGTGHNDPNWNGMSHDLTRGFLGMNFWVMETQPGRTNSTGLNNSLDRGEVRAMAWEAIGHGADAVGFWQWRNAQNGQEQDHGSILGVDGNPQPLFEEIKQTGQDFGRAESILRGTAVVSEVALLYSYDSRWAIDLEPLTDRYDQIGDLRDGNGAKHEGVLLSYYSAIRRMTQSIDVVNPDTSLDGYRLLIAPDLSIITEKTARKLINYVLNGGHLVLGPRSGTRDRFGALLTQRQPGVLNGILGGQVEQTFALENEVPVSGSWGNGMATVWGEQLSAIMPDTEAVLRYGESNGWLDNQPAVLTRRAGKGRITYIGAILDDKLLASVMSRLVDEGGVNSVLGPVPDGVEVCRRWTADRQVFVLINWGSHKTHILLPRAMKRLLTGGVTESIDLERYGVEVLLDHK